MAKHTFKLFYVMKTQKEKVKLCFCISVNLMMKKDASSNSKSGVENYHLTL